MTHSSNLYTEDLINGRPLRIKQCVLLTLHEFSTLASRNTNSPYNQVPMLEWSNHLNQKLLSQSV